MTYEADEDFLKMKNEIKGKKQKERGGEEGIRNRTESQLQLVLIIDHDTLSWLLVHFKSVKCS
jgi:hypothetical protein